MRAPLHPLSAVPSASEAYALGKPIRLAIWAYIILWIIEGALRKWILPQISTPLLLVRDPVVAIAYFWAVQRRLFPVNGFLIAMVFLMIPMLVSSLINSGVNMLVTIYGLRCDFFHLPFIFLMPQVMKRSDVEAVGKMILLSSIPMAGLMLLQFAAPRGSIWNISAGGMIDGQMPGALGRFRASGTFSFSTGVSSYLTLLSSYVVHGYISKGVYPRWLLSSALISLLFSLSISVSRHAVAAVFLVFACFVMVSILYPKFFGRFLGLAFLMIGLGIVLSLMPIVMYGFDALSSRFHDGGPIVASIGGRVINDLLSPWASMLDVPLWGWGLGSGTMVGAVATLGRRDFTLGEGEWPRVIGESGWVFGPLYLFWRIAVIGFLSLQAHRMLSRGNALSALILAACLFDILSGAFGNSSELGYAILAAGLCLAATIEDDVTASPGVGDGERKTPIMPRPTITKVRGRSLYADRLHGSENSSTDGLENPPS